MKPQTTTYHLVLLASCAVLFAVWEVIDHQWLMHMSMVTNHELDAGVTLLIVTAMSAVVFNLLGRYQKAITELNAELTAANAALSKMEATRDDRLLELARDLSFAVSGLVGQAEIALQTTTDLPNIKALSDAVDRAQKIGLIAHELLGLKHMALTAIGSDLAEVPA